MSSPEFSMSSRIAGIFRSGLASSVKTLWFLLRITVPVSLAVALLGWSGLLATIARWLAPLMGFFELPGEAAIVFLSGALLSNYSAIATMSMIGLSLRQASTLAIMCLVCHNLLVETPVMKRAGSRALTMVALRLAGALLLGWVLSRMLPADLAATPFTAHASAVRPEFISMILSWARSTALLSLRMSVIVVVIMIIQRALEEFRIMDLLSRALAPLMFVFGLPRSASFLWIVINAVGYGYGAGIIVAQVEDGKMKPQEGDLFNHHAALSHSLLEDTALYVALGIPLFWIVIPRIILALLVVWLEKLRRQVFRHSFRVGTV